MHLTFILDEAVNLFACMLNIFTSSPFHFIFFMPVIYVCMFSFAFYPDEQVS